MGLRPECIKSNLKSCSRAYRHAGEQVAILRRNTVPTVAFWLYCAYVCRLAVLE